VLARGQRVLRELWVMPGDAKAVAVVSHAGFLRKGVSGCWFANGDWRVFDLVSGDQSESAGGVNGVDARGGNGESGQGEEGQGEEQKLERGRSGVGGGGGGVEAKDGETGIRLQRWEELRTGGMGWSWDEMVPLGDGLPDEGDVNGDGVAVDGM
jgi:hypothetical protein